MTDLVRISIDDTVAVVTIDNPPVNALGQAVRQALWEAIDRAEADPEVGAIVLCAEGRTWPAGTDLRELGTPEAQPALTDLCNRIEDCTKPVLAALHGTVLGGGLELALAAHRRIAEAGTRLGFPELSLGLLPGGGGTQRAPRLIGAANTLELMLSAKPVPAAHALQIGMVDALCEGAVEAEARCMARQVSRDASGFGGEWLHADDPQRGIRDTAAFLDSVEKARTGLAYDGLPAQNRIVDCVEAALILPRDEGQEFERAAYLDLVKTPEAVALRHGFLAERRAMRQPDLAGAKPREIGHVAVIGGDRAGADMVSTLLSAGLSATLVELDTRRLARGLKRVASTQERAVESGRLTAAAREAEWDRLSGTTDLGDIADADMVIETGAAGEDARMATLARVEEILRPGAIIAVAGDFGAVDLLAEGVERPGDLIGLRFHMPPLSNRLIEVAPGARTLRDVTATGFALARRLGKVAVRSGCGGDMIGERVMAAFRLAADLLLEEGATPYQIDAAMRIYGFALGPYQMLDIEGLDRAPSYALPEEDGSRVAIRDRLIGMGRCGRKAGQGYYDYPDGERRGRRDENVLALIDAERRLGGVTQRRFSADEIHRHCLAAMANEGVRLLEEGIALRPSDIDAVMLLGHGFPRWRGGPMMAADQRGPLAMRNDLREFAARDAWFWSPRALWFELVKNGRRFGDLNGR